MATYGELQWDGEVMATYGELCGTMSSWRIMVSSSGTDRSWLVLATYGELCGTVS